MPIATRDGRLPSRDAILDAARTLFASHGLRGTTVRAIAKSSGLSNTLLYYYFPRKDDLLDALLKPPAMPIPTVPEAWTPHAISDALDFLEKTFFSWTERDDFLRMVIIECYAGNQRCLSLSTTQLNLYIDAIEPLLSVGCSRAEARERATALGFALTGLMWQAVMHDGPTFNERLSSPAGRKRVRTTIELLLPRPVSAMGAA